MKTVLRVMLLSLVATNAFATVMPWPAFVTPNTYVCSGLGMEVSIEAGQMAMNNGEYNPALSKTDIVNSAVGQMATSFVTNIADLNLSYTLILPRVILKDHDATHEFTTQLVTSSSGGFFPGPQPGVGVHNTFTELECVASFTKLATPGVREDAERILSAQTSWINMMPGPHRPRRPVQTDIQVVAEVISTGCTSAEDFSAEIVTDADGRQHLSIARENIDYCEVTPHPVSVNLRVADYKLDSALFYKNQTVPVRMRMAH